VLLPPQPAKPTLPATIAKRMPLRMCMRMSPEKIVEELDN
jgi:hypothetical protein